MTAFYLESSMSSAETTPWRAWILAARPKTLPAAVAPVIVGVGLAAADGVFSPLPAVAALTVSLLIQIGTNLANDYFDYVKGADKGERRGPTRAAQSGLISLDQLQVGIVLTFAASALVGLYLAIVGGWPLLAVGIAALVSAVAYTGGPFPIGYHGLGDLFVFLFFGLTAVCGTYYVQALSLTPAVLLAATAVGTLTVAILVVNNLRDMDTDAKAGKRTLAVLIGTQATRLEYVVLLAVAYAVPFLFWLLEWSSAWVLLPWLTVPLAARLVRAVWGSTGGSVLNQTLAGTARLDLALSALFALGLVL
jgi:1,4-dihydroxy-2-naphthoate octaprenyltransferase